MAQILPQNSAPPADPAAARLEATLASLPDDWTLLPQRRIGGVDGPEVGCVLIHPAIGIALVDLLPRRPDQGLARLREVLAAEHVVGEGDALPIVAAALDPDDIPAVGERLAAAFQAEPACDMTDQAWPGRVVDLLLDADDAAMVLLPVPEEPAPDPDYNFGAPLAADEPVLLSEPPRRHVAFAAICAVIVAVIGVGGAAAYLLTERPADTPISAAVTVPPPSPATPPPTDTAAVEPPAPSAAAPITVQPAPSPQSPPPIQSGLAAPALPPSAPAVADTNPPAVANPLMADPAADTVPHQPIQAAKSSSPPAELRAAKAPPQKPAHKDVAAVAKDKTSPLKQATKRVAALDRDAKASADAASAPPSQRLANAPPRARHSDALPDESDNPIDAADLPPLEGSSVPPPTSTADLPVGTPIPLPAPFSPATAATSSPVMLLPPITAQASDISHAATPATGPGAPAQGGLLGGAGGILRR
jgi:hypothetical protein